MTHHGHGQVRVVGSRQGLQAQQDDPPSETRKWGPSCAETELRAASPVPEVIVEVKGREKARATTRDQQPTYTLVTNEAPPSCATRVSTPPGPVQHRVDMRQASYSDDRQYTARNCDDSADTSAECDSEPGLSPTARGRSNSSARTAEICRDNLRGTCKREVCKFAHDPPAYDHPHNYAPKATKSNATAASKATSEVSTQTKWSVDQQVQAGDSYVASKTTEPVLFLPVEGLTSSTVQKRGPEPPVQTSEASDCSVSNEEQGEEGGNKRSEKDKADNKPSVSELTRRRASEAEQVTCNVTAADTSRPESTAAFLARHRNIVARYSTASPQLIALRMRPVRVEEIHGRNAISEEHEMEVRSLREQRETLRMMHEDSDAWRPVQKACEVQAKSKLEREESGATASSYPIAGLRETTSSAKTETEPKTSQTKEKANTTARLTKGQAQQQRKEANAQRRMATAGEKQQQVPKTNRTITTPCECGKPYHQMKSLGWYRCTACGNEYGQNTWRTCCLWDCKKNFCRDCLDIIEPVSTTAMTAVKGAAGEGGGQAEDRGATLGSS